MPLRTAFTDLLGIEHPIAQAPMGGSAGGALAAAVSNAGGLGMVGGGSGDRDWLARELAAVTAATDRPWGIGFLTWNVTAAAIEQALEHHPAVVMLSFGDPSAFLPAIREGGATVMLQVGDLESAERALELGADVVVAQGVESGGHSYGKARGTVTFTPLVADLAEPAGVPVLAAGGIADGRGLAASLSLGAAGALIGTRFNATQEALIDARTAQALVDGAGEDTERSRVLDVVRGAPWPQQYPGRSLPHPLLAEWRDREDELRARPDEVVARYREGVKDGSMPVPVWAGEGVDLVTSVRPAGELVRDIAEQAEAALARASGSQPPRR